MPLEAAEEPFDEPSVVRILAFDRRRRSLKKGILQEINRGRVEQVMESGSVVANGGWEFNRPRRRVYYVGKRMSGG